MRSNLSNLVFFLILTCALLPPESFAASRNVEAWASELIARARVFESIDIEILKRKRDSIKDLSKDQRDIELAKSLRDSFPGVIDNAIRNLGVNFSMSHLGQLLDFCLTDHSVWVKTSPKERVSALLGMLLIASSSYEERTNEENHLVDIFNIVIYHLEDTTHRRGQEDSKPRLNLIEPSLDIGVLFGPKGLFRLNSEELAKVANCLQFVMFQSKIPFEKKRKAHRF